MAVSIASGTNGSLRCWHAANRSEKSQFRDSSPCSARSDCLKRMNERLVDRRPGEQIEESPDRLGIQA
jgi:hypothetical protein